MPPRRHMRSDLMFQGSKSLWKSSLAPYRSKQAAVPERIVSGPSSADDLIATDDDQWCHLLNSCRVEFRTDQHVPIRNSKVPALGVVWKRNRLAGRCRCRPPSTLYQSIPPPDRPPLPPHRPGPEPAGESRSQIQSPVLGSASS